MNVQDMLREDAALPGVVRRLAEACQPQRIYLFDSKARSDARPNSHYDLMVIVPDDAPPERRDSRLAHEVLRDTGTASDVLVWLKSRFERRPCVVASLTVTILREARLVYASCPGLITGTRAWLVKAVQNRATTAYELQAVPTESSFDLAIDTPRRKQEQHR